ncbi:MAG: Uma2 family endonuclease [Blastocatellia bacterium]|nr:Uma2 family endonuclease [Blastocatellia bacterium]
MSALPKEEIKVVEYPDSDGELMADNTEQFNWIVEIKESLELIFAEDQNVFVAGDLLWYPVKGDNKTRVAPDVLVAFGRTKGRRGSYKQWEEDGIAPQVVFEVLSPGNTLKEMIKKWKFYERYGVEEYYVIDPDHKNVDGWIRSKTRPEEMEVIEEISGWVSPRLQIRFEIEDGEIKLYRPDGNLFESYVEVARKRDEERNRAEQAEREKEEALARLQQMSEKLKALGIELEPS